MAEVNVMIGGRSYGVHCRDGEEARLHHLSRMISERVDKVRRSNPGLTEVRQLLFAAILLADDLADAETELAQPSRQPAASSPPADDPASLAVLEKLAERLEAIGQGLAADLASA